MQIKFMAKRLTQNDLKKEEAGQVLEHKDYYFLASVDFLKQSEGRENHYKHKTFTNYDFLKNIIGMYLQYHQIFCFKIHFLLLQNIIFVGGPYYQIDLSWFYFVMF